MFEVKEPSIEIHGRSNPCEDVYYFCNCDKLCERTPRFFGLGHIGSSSGLRQPYEMKTRQRWILMIFIISAILVLLTLWGSGSGRGTPLSLRLDLDRLTERHKCPACFGITLCPQMIQGKIVLSDWTKYSVSKLMNQKNVFYGEWNDRGKERKLILKKLGHDHELEELDKTICIRHGKQDDCDVASSVQELIKEYAKHSEVHLGQDVLHGAKIGDASDIVLCPSQRKIDFLTAASKKFNKGQNPKTILANMLTTMLVNPEPLILEAFSSKDGWPFPQYYGSCGRIVVEEYVGRSLTQYLYEPFKTRAYLAKQLLEMANKFEENASNFILYMADPSPDNFAVNEETNILKMIDLENIIVVDKQQLIMSKVNHSGELLVSESLNCDAKTEPDGKKCFTFSVESLCSRPITDHNYYAVCAGILASDPLSSEFPGGLLHSVPKEDAKKLPKLAEIIQQCKDPVEGSLGWNRVQAAQALLHLLSDYLKDSANDA